MKKLAIFTLVLVVTLICVAALIVLSKQPSLEPEKMEISEAARSLVNNILNEDVEWDGTMIGILPHGLKGATLTLSDSREDIIPLLLDTLVEEDKFVAAHVLLVILTSGKYPLEDHRGGILSEACLVSQSRSEAWYGLRIQLYSSGRISYDGNDLSQLQLCWKTELER